MVVLAEFAIHSRATVTTISLQISFHFAARDIENRHVTASLGRRAVRAAAAEENRRVRNNGETMRMTSEFVQLHKLAVFGIGLRQQSLRVIGARYRDRCIEHAAWRVIRGTLQVLAGLRNRNLRENFVIGRSRDETEKLRIVV